MPGITARLRRVTFPQYFAAEFGVGAALPLALALVAAAGAGLSLTLTAAAVLGVSYLPEWALARAKGWHAPPRMLLAMVARDLMLPAVWVRGWAGRAVEWRGNEMTIRARATSDLQEAAGA